MRVSRILVTEEVTPSMMPVTSSTYSSPSQRERSHTWRAGVVVARPCSPRISSPSYPGAQVGKPAGGKQAGEEGTKPSQALWLVERGVRLAVLRQVDQVRAPEGGR